MRKNKKMILNSADGMRRISLALIFTLVFSFIAPQGSFFPASVEAAPTADGRMFYSIGSTAPQNRTYAASTNTFGAQTATQTGAIPSFMVAKAAPTRSEMMAGYVTTTGVLYIYRWDGTTWINETSAAGGWGATVTVGGNGVNGRRFDIAYENTSGKAMVVYSTNVTTSGGAKLAYRTWNGTAWSTATNITTARSNQVSAMTWVKLKARTTAGSNEIALVAQDSGTTTTANTSILTSLIWNGSAWGTEPATAHATNMTSTTANGVQNDVFDLAYESVSGDLLVVFTTSAANSYRTYSAGTWGTVGSLSATARLAPMQMVAISDPLSDTIAIAFGRSASANIYGNYWSGTAMGTAATIGTTGQAPAVNKRTITGQYLVTGGVSYGVFVWGSSTTGTIGYNTFSGTAFGTAGTWPTGIGAVAFSWMDADKDPTGTDTMMLTFSDANSDLWAKRLVLSAGPVLTWSPADGSVAISTTLTNITTQNFDFDYTRYVPPSTLTASANTVIATSPQFENATGLVMQRFQVDSDAAGYGHVELSSLSLDDTGTATTIPNVYSYISTTSSATLPAGSVLLGSLSAWNGAAATVSFTGGTAADRTVTNGTPKYIYIVYDLQAGMAGQTIQSSISNVAVVAPDNGVPGAVGTSTAITIKFPSSNTSCGSCHAYPPLDGARNATTGAVVGDHQVHLVACSTCHVAPATETSADFGHRNGLIQMQASLGYSRTSSFAQSNNPTTGTCATAACHGGVATPQWGVGTVTCSSCHSNPMDAADGAPTRRAVFSEFANNTIGHMQYNVGAAANATVKADCTKCHAEPVSNHVNNTLDNGRSAGTFGDATFCLDCHKSGATNNVFSTQSRTSPNIDGSGWTTGTTAKSGTGFVLGMQSHRVAATGGCTDCHGDGAGNARVHGGTVNNLMKQSSQYATCFNGTSTACHGSSSTVLTAGGSAGPQIGKAATATGGIHPIFGAAVPLANIKSAIMRTRTTLGTPATTTDGHDDLFVRGWSATSTMVCSDCHSQNGTTGVRGPHGSSYGYILKGLDQTAITTATSGRTLGGPYPLTFAANNQENICLNCHAADIYGDGMGGVAANAAIDTAGHTVVWNNSGASQCGGSNFAGTKSARINCLNCHAGSNPAGGYGAHGSTRATSAAGVTFAPGGTTQGTGFMNGDSWTAAPDVNGCYSVGVANNWNTCTQTGPHN